MSPDGIASIRGPIGAAFVRDLDGHRLEAVVYDQPTGHGAADSGRAE